MDPKNRTMRHRLVHGLRRVIMYQTRQACLAMGYTKGDQRVRFDELAVRRSALDAALYDDDNQLDLETYRTCRSSNVVGCASPCSVTVSLHNRDCVDVAMDMKAQGLNPVVLSRLSSPLSWSC